MDYICNECNQPCLLTSLDIGIGRNEVWGSVTNDVQLVTVSTCCEADYHEKDECEPTKEVDDD